MARKKQASEEEEEEEFVAEEEKHDQSYQELAVESESENQQNATEQAEVEQSNPPEDQENQFGEDNENENNNNDDNDDQVPEGASETQSVKRVKTEREEGEEGTQEQGEGAKTGPTKVLFVRGIPFNATEQDIATIVAPFGAVVDSLLLLKQQTAFIEMESDDAAQKALAYFSGMQPTLKGNTIQFLPSNRDKIEHKNKQEKSDQKEDKPPRRVILVTVSNKIYPITIEVLHTVFQRCGNVHKIVTFTPKTGGFQAFIQYSNVSEAQEAMRQLDNQNIYSNCCTLTIQYSDFDTLNVKYNNEKTRDFTNTDLPAAPPMGNKPMPNPDPRGFGNQNLRGPNQFGNRNQNPTMGGFNQGGFNQGGFNQGGFNQGGFNQGGFNQGGFNQGGFNQGGFNQGGFNQNPSTVLHITNLNPQECNPDVLFTLFGVYGDVQRVKIMYNKQDNALIQMATNEQCINAIKFLNGVSLYGTPVSVSLSKNSYVSMPRNQNTETERFTKDYANSPFHRYKGGGAKQYQHICAPSASLHISNLAESTTEDQIRNVFSTYGTVNKINLFTPPSTQMRMGVVEMGSVDQAIDALIKTHNQNLNNQLLRVTFSQPKKKKMGFNNPNPTTGGFGAQPGPAMNQFSMHQAYNPYGQ